MIESAFLKIAGSLTNSPVRSSRILSLFNL